MSVPHPNNKTINEVLIRTRPQIIAALQKRWPRNHQADIEDAVHDAIARTSRLRELPEQDLTRYLIRAGHNNLSRRYQQESRHQPELKLSDTRFGERTLMAENPEIFATGPEALLERSDIESILLWLTTDEEPIAPSDRAAKAYAAIQIATEQQLSHDQLIVFKLLLRQQIQCNQDIAAHVLVNRPTSTISDWRRLINDIVTEQLIRHGYEPQLFREL